MVPYSLIPLGSNMSSLITNLEIRHESMRGFERGTTYPTVIVVGMLHLKTDYAVLGEVFVRRSVGGAWELFCDPKFAQINCKGTIAYIDNQPMGTKILTGLGAGSAAGHSVRFEQVLLLAGGTMTGNIVMGGHGITGLPAPTATGHAARWDDCIPDKRKFNAPTTNGGSVSVNLGFRPTRVMLKGWFLTFTHSGGVTNGRAAQSVEYLMLNGNGVGEGGELVFNTTIGAVYVSCVLTNSATGFDLQLTAQGGVAITAIGGEMAATSYRNG